LALCLGTLCILDLPGISQAQSKAAGIVGLVDSLYYQGRFREAELTALRALQESGNLVPVDRGLLHKTLGFTYVAMGENDKARSQFTDWLVIDPFAQLDSVYVSPKIISVFQEAKIAQKKTLQPSRDPAELKTVLSAAKRSLFFPGLGQLYSGRQAKGITMFVSEAFLLGSFAYCQVQYTQARDNYLQERNPVKIPNLYDRYNNYNRARYGTLILAAGVYIYSLYDALSVPPPTKKTTPLSLKIAPSTDRLISLTFSY
jgi:tetratricopeptide (TPR) repeat protein